MVAPGDPEFATDLARRAASVSHDGEAIHGAQVVRRSKRRPLSNVIGTNYYALCSSTTAPQSW